MYDTKANIYVIIITNNKNITITFCFVVCFQVEIDNEEILKDLEKEK